MKILFFILLTCLLIDNQALSQAALKMPQFPKYEMVEKRYMGIYELNNPDNEYLFSLAKKSDGWHILKIDIRTREIINDDLYWDAKTSKYLQLDHPKKNTDYERFKEEFYQNRIAPYYTSIIPFWGYPGWEMDVITTYSNKKNLSDSLLNGIGRSYSSLARNLLSEMDFTDKLNHYELPKGQNALNQEQLATYRKYSAKAVEFYERLWKINPDFENKVADSKNMFANEVMTSFLDLRTFQNEQAAQLQLRNGLYDAFYIELAKNYLNACDSNAILFTFGDIDTYPLLYVQEVEDFRKDVLIVQSVFLNYGRYVNHLANFEGEAKKLFLTVDTNTYKSEESSYFPVIEKFGGITVKQALLHASSTNDEDKYEFSNGQKLNYFPSRKIRIPITDSLINSGDSSINIEISTSYILNNEFSALDIINTNCNKRPIYFTHSFNFFRYNGLEHYLENIGLVYKLTNIKKEQIEEYNKVERMNIDKLYDLFSNTSSFSALNTLPDKNFITRNRIISFYRRIFGILAKQLIKSNKKDKALEVINLAYTSFPFESIAPDYYSLPLLEAFYMLGERKKASNISNLYALNIKKRMSSKKKGTMQDVSRKQRLSFELNSLNNLVLKYSNK